MQASLRLPSLRPLCECLVSPLFAPVPLSGGFFDPLGLGDDPDTLAELKVGGRLVVGTAAFLLGCAAFQHACWSCPAWMDEATVKCII